MIVLSVLVYFPNSIIIAIGVLLIAGHNLFDTFYVPGNNVKAFLWACLHDPTWEKNSSQLMVKGHAIIVDYPVLPWIGVIALGYCFGNLYKPATDAFERRKKLIIFGSAAVLLFILLRLINVYGDPHPWATQKSSLFTVLSFLKVTKYPPSLQFILLTIGPAILFLAIAEKYLMDFGKAIIKIGRVPMFFYLLHIYLIHVFAMIAAKLTGYEWSDMVSRVPLTPTPKGFGFSLPIVYIVWVIVVLLLYPLCKWYDNYKSYHKEKWWLSYL